MDPHGPIAQRFPLVARFRPACLPLPQRVYALVDLADTAVKKSDQGIASAVYNQAALLASDLGLPDLAREMCHQHAAAYLHACPLPSTSVIRGLEPIVNLARLQIRAGRTDEGRQRLIDLYEAVETGTAARFEGIEVPTDLPATDKDRHEIGAWLWRVLLADGTRASPPRDVGPRPWHTSKPAEEWASECSMGAKSPYWPPWSRVTRPQPLVCSVTRCPANRGSRPLRPVSSSCAVVWLGSRSTATWRSWQPPIWIGRPNLE